MDKSRRKNVFVSSGTVIAVLVVVALIVGATGTAAAVAPPPEEEVDKPVPEDIPNDDPSFTQEVAQGGFDVNVPIYRSEESPSSVPVAVILDISSLEEEVEGVDIGGVTASADIQGGSLEEGPSVQDDLVGFVVSTETGSFTVESLKLEGIDAEGAEPTEDLTYTVDTVIGGLEDSVEGPIGTQETPLETEEFDVYEPFELPELEEVALDLSADRTEVEQGGDVNFTLTIPERNEASRGKLSIRNEEGDELEQIRVGSDGEREFEFGGKKFSPGSYSVRATRGPTQTTLFEPDEIGIEVVENETGTGPGTGLGTEIEVDVAVEPPVEGENATYELNFTYTSVGEETAEFISVDFGTETGFAPLTEGTEDVVLLEREEEGDDMERRVAAVVEVSDEVLVAQLGEGDEIRGEEVGIGQNFTLLLEGVTVPEQGTYNLTLGLHEEGNEILGIAAEEFAANSSLYTIEEATEDAGPTPEEVVEAIRGAGENPDTLERESLGEAIFSFVAGDGTFNGVELTRKGLQEAVFQFVNSSST